jgi:hypothetical protein
LAGEPIMPKGRTVPLWLPETARRDTHPARPRPRSTGDPGTTGCNRIKEVTMTRRIRLWITAVLSIAATALMVGLAVAAQAGVSHAHTHPPLAGISLNGID